MKALIQRVKRASVTINNKLYSSIDKGILVFLGVEKLDEKENAEKLAQKISSLRIFEDEHGKMNLKMYAVKFLLFHNLLYVLIAKKAQDHLLIMLLFLIKRMIYMNILLRI